MVLFYSLSPITFLFQCKESGAFTVLVDNYVKEEEGTGIVHQAPYFGAVSTINLASVLMRSKCHWPLSCVCVYVYHRKMFLTVVQTVEIPPPKEKKLASEIPFHPELVLKMVG